MSKQIWPEDHKRTAAAAILRLKRASTGAPLSQAILWLFDMTALLATAKNGRQYNGRLLRALGQVSKDTLDPVGELESALERVAGWWATEQAKARKTWDLFFGINIPAEGFSPEGYRVRVFGADFVVTPRNSFQERWDRCASDDPYHSHDGKLTSLVVATKSDGEDVRAAYVNAERAFETFRGCIEARMNFGVHQIMRGIGPLRKFPPAEWVIAASDGTPSQFLALINPATTRPSGDPAPTPLTPDIVKQSFELFEFLNEVPADDSVDALLSVCIRLYSQALEQAFPHAQFLGLWQCAEAICGTKPGQEKGDPVPLRLGWILQKKKEFEAIACREIAKYLQSLRHNLVHKGTLYQIIQEHVELLKFFCEEAITFWMINRIELPTLNHMHAFYSMIGQDADLRNAQADAHLVLSKLIPEKKSAGRTSAARNKHGG